MIEDDIESMIKRTQKFKDDLNHYDKNLERIMSKYKIGGENGGKKKSRKQITADKFLDDVKKGKVMMKTHKHSYDLIDDIRKELRQKTLKKLDKGNSGESKKKFSSKNSGNDENFEDNKSFVSNNSSILKSKNRFGVFKKRVKREPSPKLKSLKLAYHKQKIHIEKPPLESSNSDLLMNKSSKSSQREENLDSSKNELIQDKSEIKENKLRNLDWEDEIEIERSNVRISFLTQNQRATFIKENEEQSGLLEYSIENSHIGMLAQGNRLSTIKNQNFQNLEKIEKLRQLLSRKKNLENEILNILC